MTPQCPLCQPETWAALERLISIARGDTHQSRFTANFLLAWWNAKELGGFDFTVGWDVDRSIQEDMIRVFTFFSRNNVYPSNYSFKSEFEKKSDFGDRTPFNNQAAAMQVI